MQPEIRVVYEQKLLAGLLQLEEGNHHKFRMMYAINNKRSVSEAEVMPLKDVIKEMPDEKLDHALFQVNNSLKQKVKGDK